eukprot:scaffold33258_cov62-Phaeocystis_antarctica.AAC.5
MDLVRLDGPISSVTAIAPRARARGDPSGSRKRRFMTTTCDTVQVCGQNTECCNQTISVGGEKTETAGSTLFACSSPDVF